MELISLAMFCITAAIVMKMVGYACELLLDATWRGYVWCFDEYTAYRNAQSIAIAR